MSAKNHTILVVDDSLTNRTLLKKIFNRDYNVKEAKNGVEALAALRRGNISLVLLDIYMPVMDGLTALKEIHNDKALSDIPVLIVTSINDEEAQLETFPLGAVDVITKPFNTQSIQLRVKNILDRIDAQELMKERELENLRLVQENELFQLAEIDEVTGLSNKNAFYRRLGEYLTNSPKANVALLRFDMDHFKIYNDIFGTDAGDILLKNIGKYLLTSATEAYVVGHLEADHFGLLYPNDESKIAAFFNGLVAWFSDNPAPFNFLIRMGVYVVSDNSVEPRLMCDRALFAIKRSKLTSVSTIGYYDDDIRKQLLNEQQLVSELEVALTQNQFEIWFQPQYNYSTNTVCGAEALVRWRHPRRGLVAPTEFIPLMEKNGMIKRLDELVWEGTCKALREWLDSVDDNGKKCIPPISVNMSRVSLYSVDLCPYFIKLTDKYGIPRKLLRLEITESAYMNNPDSLISMVKDLKDNGFVVEMDDFGCGYSSLNTLKDVPVDTLKLDMKFLSNCYNTSRGESILNSVIKMARWLNLPVIAEGVETKDQADFLFSISCPLMQGFYFSKPMPLDEFKRKMMDGVTITPNDAKSESAPDYERFLGAFSEAEPLFNNLIDGAVLVEYRNKNVEIIRANRSFYAIFGCSSNELIEYEKHAQDFYDVENKRLFLSMLDDAILNGESKFFELYFKVIRTNRPVYIRAKAVQLLKKDDAHVMYIGFSDMAPIRELKSNLNNKQTELDEAIADMQELKTKFSNSLANIPVAIAVYELRNGQAFLQYFSDNLYELYGYTKDELNDRMERGLPSLNTDIICEKLENTLKDVQGREHTSQQMLSLKRGDGSDMIVNVVSKLLNDKPYPVVYTVQIDVTDVAEKDLKLQEQHERFLSIVSNTKTIISDYDRRRDRLTLTIPCANGTVDETIFNDYLKEKDKEPECFVKKDVKDRYVQSLETAFETGDNNLYVYLADYGNGERWYRCRTVSLKDEKGYVYRVLCISDDYNEEYKEIETLKTRAEIDELTQLYNKHSAKTLITAELAHASEKNQGALMIVDIDDFRSVNEKIGHIMADKILSRFADELSDIFRKSDIVGRFGGDEFIIYMPACGKERIAIDKANEILNRTLHITYDDNVQLTCSVGIVLVEVAGVSFEPLFAQADYALYKSKNTGKNTYTFFDPITMGENVSELGVWRDTD